MIEPIQSFDQDRSRYDSESFAERDSARRLHEWEKKSSQHRRSRRPFSAFAQTEEGYFFESTLPEDVIDANGHVDVYA